jgi:hypothetical protein
MRLEFRMLAGVATAACGLWWAAGSALGSESPPVAIGRIVPIGASDPQHDMVSRSDDGLNWMPKEWVAVSNDRLDNMRGGFDLQPGLQVSFGISRAAYVNGNLVATTNFNIPDVANMTTQQAQMLANVNAGTLIQNGPGNVVQAGALPGITGAVIQNSLNDQQIKALTSINVSVNTLSAFKNMNTLATLTGALTMPVLGR